MRKVLRVLQGCFKEVLRLFQGSFKGVSRKIAGCFIKFCFAWISSQLPEQKESLFNDGFRVIQEASRVVQGVFKASFLDILRVIHGVYLFESF